MKIILLAIFWGVSATAFSQLSHEDSMIIEVCKKYPLLSNLIDKPFGKFQLKKTDGKTITNEFIAGKVTFISFWFAQCHPCMEEIPVLNTLYKQFKNNPNFRMLSITFEPDSIIKKVKKKFGIQYPVYSTSKDECSRLLTGAGYPTNLIVNPAGIIIFSGETSYPDFDGFENAFNATHLAILKEMLKK